MADRTTATNVKATATNAKATATNARATTTAAAAKTSGTVTHVATTHTTNARSGSKTTAAVIISKNTPSPTPTIAPTSSGPSGAVIGGIAGGAAVLIAIVGLLCYKRRRRATVAVAAAKGGKGGDPEASLSPSGAISGPMSLAPDDGIKAPPPHRAEAQFREQQHFKPGMRDELFAQPTSPTQKNQTPMTNNSLPGTGNQGSINNKMNEKDGGYHMSPPNSYEDTLMNDYFGGADAKESEAIGAQRPTPQARDVSHGNLTPAPEYYMGKEDIDPRRDLRGFDVPETYVKNSTVTPAANQGKPSDSPRSSCSSDRSSAYLTLEEAQMAHNSKMMGHKQSISSIDMLIADQFPQATQGRTNQCPDHLLSVAMTESTLSMMPSLPPASSPTAFNGVKHQNGSPLRGPNPNPGPISGVARVDPYAESAFSEDDRSVTSGSYYNPNYAQEKQQQLQMQQMQQQQQQQQQYPYSGGQSPPGYYPYSPQVLSPYQHSPTPYAQQFQGQPYQGQQQQGYNNNYNTNNNNNLNNRPQQPPQSGPGVQRDGPYGTYI